MVTRAGSDRRVGAAVLVLGILWCHVPRRGSAGDAAKAPARGGGQALPGGACRALVPGGGGVAHSFRKRLGYHRGLAFTIVFLINENFDLPRFSTMIR